MYTSQGAGLSVHCQLQVVSIGKQTHGYSYTSGFGKHISELLDYPAAIVRILITRCRDIPRSSI